MSNVITANFDLQIERKEPAIMTAKRKKAVKKPLTKKEREQIFQDCWEACARIYACENRRAMNNFEDKDDLKQEAWYHFDAALNYICKDAFQAQGRDLNGKFINFFREWCRLYFSKTISDDRKKKRRGSQGVLRVAGEELVDKSRLISGENNIDHQIFMRIFIDLPAEVQDALFKLIEGEIRVESLAVHHHNVIKRGHSIYETPFDLLEAVANALERITTEVGFSSLSVRTRGEAIIHEIHDYFYDGKVQREAA